MKRSDIEALDSTDPLKAMAAEFYLPEDTIYLDGNSLGAMPLAVVERLNDVVTREWARELIHSWNDNDWFILPRRIGDKIAALVGASPGEVIVSDCVSVNLFKLIVGAIKRQEGRRKIVTELGNFPTNLYVMQGIEKLFAGEVELVSVERAEVEKGIDDDTAVVVLTHAHYKSSELWDMQQLTRLAHDQGALVLWDLCHSAGVMPLGLSELGVDMAVGCTYKYLNGGPGAPAFLYLAESLQQDVEQPIAGWWAHADPFLFSDYYEPAADIRQLQSGTQSVLALAALEIGIDLALKQDMAEVRSKSQALGNTFIRLLQQSCPELVIASPVDDNRRGSHVSVRHEEGYAITRALSHRGIIVDFRAPDIIRFGFSPLYNSYSDTWNTVAALKDLLDSAAWDRPEFRQKAAVT